MSTWIIGDVHGYFDTLQNLLAAIEYVPSDHLIFVGDLVSGGGQSAEVVRWCAEHDAIVTLGNHDLHMLAVWEGARPRRKKDDFDDVLEAPDAPDLIGWLAGCPLTYHLPSFDTLIVHAGLLPSWTIEDAIRVGTEVEDALMDADPMRLFTDMYGNKPGRWRDDLRGARRIRCAINALTRMRCLTRKKGKMRFDHSGLYDKIPRRQCAWFDHPARPTGTQIVFGHWSALGARVWEAQNVVSLDAGIRWDRNLAAFRLEDRKLVQV